MQADNSFDELLSFDFYDRRIKQCNWLYFHFLLAWTNYPKCGRVMLQRIFSLEFGIFLSSSMVSRIMLKLGLNGIKKQRIKVFFFSFQIPISVQISAYHDQQSLQEFQLNCSAADILLKEQATSNLPQLSSLEEEDQSALLHTTHQLASGKTLSEIREENPKKKPFQRLIKLGKKLNDFVIRPLADTADAIAIAIDEKIIKKAFNPEMYKNFGKHYVSRVKTYLPSIMVEVAGLVRSGRLAEVVGHFFPYPQVKYDCNGNRMPLRKFIYLISFLEQLFISFGHLILLADANYASKRLIKWLNQKKWHFIMRFSSTNRKKLRVFNTLFDLFESCTKLDFWFYDEEFGGKIRIIGRRYRWTNAKGIKKEKRYFYITTLDWDWRDVIELYRKRWTLENTFKALPILDKLPGMNPDLFRGFFALTLQVLAPLCYQTMASSSTLAKLLSLPVQISINQDDSSTNSMTQVKVTWQNIPTRFARHLMSYGLNSHWLEEVIVKL